MNQLFHRLNLRKSLRGNATVSGEASDPSLHEISSSNKKKSEVRLHKQRNCSNKSIGINANTTNNSNASATGPRKISHVTIQFRNSKHHQQRRWNGGSKNIHNTTTGSYSERVVCDDLTGTEEESTHHPSPPNNINNSDSFHDDDNDQRMCGSPPSSPSPPATPCRTVSTTSTSYSSSNNSNTSRASNRRTFATSQQQYHCTTDAFTPPTTPPRQRKQQQHRAGGDGSSDSSSHSAGDNDSDGYHRYDDLGDEICNNEYVKEEADEEQGFAMDYRGHFVVASPPRPVKGSSPQAVCQLESIVQMALRASQRALKMQPEYGSSLVPEAARSSMDREQLDGANDDAVGGLLSGNNNCSSGGSSSRKQRRARELASERLDESGNVLFEQGKLDQAFEMYEEALQLKRQSLLGQFNAIQHQRQDKDAHSIVSKEERGRVLVSMATSINNLTYLRQVRGNMSSRETLESYEMALHIKREILGPDHISVAKTLSNIGSVYYLQENFHDAAAFYEHARDILTINLGDDHLDVCTVTSNLGDVHCSMKQWQRAVEEYRAAFKLRWRLLGPADPKVVRLMEQIAELEMEIDKSRRKTSSGEKSSKLKRNSIVDRTTRYYRPVLTDLRKLQRELRQDIEELDSLERQWPIDMIKDKASLFKELRELKGDNNGEHDVEEISKLNNESDSEVSSVLSNKIIADLLPDENAIVALNDSTPDDTVSSQALADEPIRITIPESNSGDLTAKTMSISSLPDNIDTGVNSDNSFVNASILVERSSASMVVTPEPSTPTKMIPYMDDCASYPRLSPDQRKQALQSVRERLALLRANRDSTSLCLPETSRQPIQLSIPTVPKIVRTTEHPFPPTTPAILLKTSELLTMKQGIEALRSIPNDSVTTVKSQTRRHVQKKPRRRKVLKNAEPENNIPDVCTQSLQPSKSCLLTVQQCHL